VRRAAELFFQPLHEARLPDPGLAADQYDLSLAFLGELPAVAQQLLLLLASDEAREPACDGGGVDAPAHTARLNGTVECERLGQSRKGLHPAFLDDEETRHETVGRRRHEDAAGLGRGLHARRHVRHLAESERLRSGAVAYGSNDYRAGMDAHSGCESAPLGGDTARSVDQLEARTHGALGRVIHGVGPPEVGEEPVAEVLRHVAAVSSDDRVRGPLVGRQHRAPVLGVEARRDLGRAHEITEHDREWAALAGLALLRCAGGVS
jgi:hypothetical protein